MDFLAENIFQDRKDAGKKLSSFLDNEDLSDAFILALPRGGVVVANEVAKDHHLPMDVVISRKIGAPGHLEFGIGAISENKTPTFNSTASGYFDPESPEVKAIIDHETEELERRISLYRDGNPLPSLEGKKVIVVDDGLATGATAVAAAKFLRTLNPGELVLAVPVGPSIPGSEVEKCFDRIICLHALSNLRGVGLWYEDFAQVEDEEVLKILKDYH